MVAGIPKVIQQWSSICQLDFTQLTRKQACSDSNANRDCRWSSRAICRYARQCAREDRCVYMKPQSTQDGMRDFFCMLDTPGDDDLSRMLMSGV